MQLVVTMYLARSVFQTNLGHIIIISNSSHSFEVTLLLRHERPTYVIHNRTVLMTGRSILNLCLPSVFWHRAAIKWMGVCVRPFSSGVTGRRAVWNRLLHRMKHPGCAQSAFLIALVIVC